MRRHYTLLLLVALIVSAVCAPLPLAAQNCTNAAEVSEVARQPDNSPLAPGAPFIISWTIHNTGDCTWDRSYRLIFSDGERMSGPRTIRLSYDVEPDQNLYLEMDLTAPTLPGAYSGTWRLRDGGGDDFGPDLTIAIEVGAADETNSEVVLPEVLVFGGGGGGGYGISACLDNDALPDSPTMLVFDDTLSDRFATLYFCNFPEGAVITVTATNPQDESFVHSYVQGTPESDFDNEGVQYTGTVQTVGLFWMDQAPSGNWLLTATGADFEDEATIDVPQPVKSYTSGRSRYVEIWPDAPMDPFTAAEECYELPYAPGQKLLIGGAYFSPNAKIQLGFYQDRVNSAYLTEQVAVPTDADGSFVFPYTTPNQPGYYDVVVMAAVDASQYLDNDTQYFGNGPGSASSCIKVGLESQTENPLRLAFVEGFTYSDVQVYDFTSGDTFDLYDMPGECISEEPAWWPGDQWVIYQSNCAPDGNGGFVAQDYDLFASQVERTKLSADEEPLVQMTDTPDLDETEPDANFNGEIVYRQTPSGAPLDQSGELWLYDTGNGTFRDLGLVGRAPVWSPDGSSIAFMSDVEGNWQIYRYTVSDEKLSNVSQGCKTQCSNPTWSPNSKQILYEVAVAADDLTPQGLWLAPMDGSSKPKRYLAGEYSHPTWSSEGWIAFQGKDGIYRATPGSHPAPERYLYADQTLYRLLSPVWSH